MSSSTSQPNLDKTGEDQTTTPGDSVELRALIFVMAGGLNAKLRADTHFASQRFGKAMFRQIELALVRPVEGVWKEMQTVSLASQI